MNDIFSLPPDAEIEALDRRGIFARPGESRADFLVRANGLQNCVPDPADPELADALPMPPEILREGAARTEALYGFAADFAPGYFSPHGFGLLWAGCAVEDDAGRIFFLLRSEFAHRKRWLLYDRAEILAHEQCHAARAVLADHEFEEHFAYLTSSSALRRFAGNWFRTRRDSLFFLAGTGVLLAAEILAAARILPDLWLWPFVLIALAAPAFLFLRNTGTRKTYFQAKEHLAAAGFDRPDAMLFRATTPEIRRIARTETAAIPALLAEWAEKELRWHCGIRRFAPEKKHDAAL